MGTSLDLLKMLEPSVRPTGAGGSPKVAGKPPIESRSFESLLEEAQSIPDGSDDPSALEGVSDAKPKKCDPLASLGGLDRIENASLRQIVAGAAEPTATKPSETGLKN